jgi:hypothetical protein
VARKRWVECSFLIPIRRDRNLSDGGRHGRRVWTWLEERLTEFGGASRDTGLYEGWYLDPDTGESMKDQSRRYIVAVPPRRVGRVRALLREACGMFRQKCIYLSIAGYVEFVEGPSHESR